MIDNPLALVGMCALPTNRNAPADGGGELNPADGERFVVTHCYQLPGVPSSSNLVLHKDVPNFARMIRQGKVVRVPDDFPAETEPEREYVRRTGLKSNLTITGGGDVRTARNNPVDFRASTSTVRLGLEFDAPLARLLERNGYRETLIQYQRSRRDFIHGAAFAGVGLGLGYGPGLGVAAADGASPGQV